MPVTLGQIHLVPLNGVGHGKGVLVHHGFTLIPLRLPEGQAGLIRLPGDNAVFLRQPLPLDGQRVDCFQVTHRIILVDGLPIFTHICRQEGVETRRHGHGLVRAVDELIYGSVCRNTVIPGANEMHVGVL